MSAPRSIRGIISALLVSALVAGGAILGGGAAYADELPADPAIEQAQAEQQTESPQPGDEVPAEAPNEVPAEAPGGTPAEGPAEGTVPPAAGEVPTPGVEASPADAEVEAPEPVWAPQVSVALADGTPLVDGATVYKDDEIVVTGSGFDPLSHPALGRPPVTAGDPSGNYVVFGNFADGDGWRPSASAAAGTRVVSPGAQRWAMTDATFNNLDPRYVNAVKGQRVPLSTAGTFEARMTAKAAASEPGSYGVFTYVAGGGANDAAQELAVRLTYVDAERPPVWAPQVSVALADGTPLVDGATVYKDDEIVVTGSGFDPLSHPRPGPPAGRPPVTEGDPTGNYVVFGNFADGDGWRPSASAAAGTRVVSPDAQRWAMTDATFNNLDPRYVNAVKGQRVPLSTAGTFEARMTAKAAASEPGSYGVFTYVAGGGANDAAQELAVRLTYVDAERPPVWAPQVSVALADGTPLVDGATVYKDDEIVVTGSGFDPLSHPRPGPPAGRPPVTEGDPTGNYVVFGNFADGDGWRPSASAAAGTRVVSPDAQRWAMTDATFNNLDPRYVNAVKGQRVPLSTAGTFEARMTAKAAASEPGSYGVFTYVAGGGANDAAQELAVRLTYVDAERPPVWAPQVSVALADGTPLVDGATVYKDDEIVVTGSGFDPLSHPRPGPPAGRPPVTEGDPTGNYVVFGNFADGDGWRPSASAAAGTRVVSPDAQRWAMTDATFNNLDPRYVNAVKGQRVPLSTAGTFEARMTAKAAASEPGSYGVFTYVAGGGANDAAQELALRLNYVDSERPAGPGHTPKIEVFKADGTTLLGDTEVFDGDKIVVKGTGFDPEMNVGGAGVPIPSNLPQGNFVVFGNFASVWQPSAGAPLASRMNDPAARQWAITDAVLEQIPAEHRPRIDAQRVKLNDDGSFVATIPVVPTATPLPNGNWGIYTYPGGVDTPANPAQELAFPVNYKGGKVVEPEKPATGGLVWGFNENWNYYVKNIANGTIAATNGAAATPSGQIGYEQVKGGDYSVKTGLGTIRYQGTVRYVSEDHGFDIALRNPWIVFTPTGASITAEVSRNDTSGLSDMARITVASITPGSFTEAADGSRKWTDVPGKFAQDLEPSGWAQYASAKSAPLTFIYGSETDAKPIEPGKPNPKPEEKPAPPAPIPPGTGAQLAGSLTWGVSSGFAAYTTDPKRPAKGSISTNGVGGGTGGYVFPQAAGGSWNASTQTGSVQYSGVVTFTGHKGAMVESFANPVITVNDDSSGTLTAGGRTFGLNLAAGSKSVGSNGEVSWSGVPVSGMVSGSGGGGGGEFAADPVSFTVGAVSGVRYGSTTVGAPSTKRTAAATAPTTTGIRVITPAEDIVPGGEIEFEASGFQANERDVLVVMYSEPRVLDDAAGANAAGVVRWIGTLPEDVELGEHTITLQGSIDAGATFTVLDPKKAEADKQKRDSAASAPKLDVAAAQTAGISETGAPVWVWWVGAGVLLVIAAAMAGMLVAQRRSGMKDLQMFGMS